MNKSQDPCPYEVHILAKRDNKLKPEIKDSCEIWTVEENEELISVRQLKSCTVAGLRNVLSLSSEITSHCIETYWYF